MCTTEEGKKKSCAKKSGDRPCALLHRGGSNASREVGATARRLPTMCMRRRACSRPGRGLTRVRVLPQTRKENHFNKQVEFVTYVCKLKRKNNGDPQPLPRGSFSWGL